MAKPDKKKSLGPPVRDAVQSRVAKGAPPKSAVRDRAAGTCEDCRATTAFQAWHSIDLTPSFNVFVSFADWKIVPKGKRAVIEFVTAQIIVPSGEWARLRMYTSLGRFADESVLGMPEAVVRHGTVALQVTLYCCENG